MTRPNIPLYDTSVVISFFTLQDMLPSLALDVFKTPRIEKTDVDHQIHQAEFSVKLETSWN